MAIRNFQNKATEDINYGVVSKIALKLLPQELHRKARIKLAKLGAATSIQDLRELKGKLRRSYGHTTCDTNPSR